MAHATVEARREYQNARRRKNREDFFSGKACNKCGSVDDLQLDHVDPKTKKYRPTELWNMSPNNPKRIAELKKCQILCYECHLDKTMGKDGDMNAVKQGVSKSMICSKGHDLNVVGWYKSVTRTGFIGKSCAYCQHVYDASRGRCSRKTPEEFSKYN